MRIKKILIVVTFLFVGLASSSPAFAQVPVQENIESFNDDITINADGTIKVLESINYDFGYEAHHGIFRDIPFTKVDESTNKKYKLDFHILSVKDEAGKSYRYSTTSEDSTLEIKIGDPNRTVTGKHTYIIEYTVAGALGYFPEQDELYWNVTGTEWQIPIGTASATLHLPKTVEGVKALCFTGNYRSQDSNCSTSVTSNGADYAVTQPLNSNQGLTVVMGFPKGTVAELQPKEIIAFTDTPFGKVVFFLSVIGIFLLALYWYVIYPLKIIFKWWLHGRDPKSTTPKVRAWFEAPTNKDGRVLTPGEVGTVVDERADFQDITATIVDLARRGNFKIEERKKDDFYFVKGEEYLADNSMLPHERELLSDIFGSSNVVRIKDKKLYKVLEDVKSTMYEEVVKNGYFPEDPSKIRTFYEGMAMAGLFTANFPLFISSMIFGRSLSRRTEEGVAVTNIALSLKNFLSSQERQLAYQAKNQMMFEKMLPYAVAFGVESIWAERFKDIKLAEPDWYSGYNSTAFNSHMFVHSLDSSFSRVQSAATPPRSSSTSSGFSGGGSSGGGGGGGGGGSW